MPFKVKAALLIALLVFVVLAVLLVTGAISPFEEEPISGSLVVWDVAGREELDEFFSLIRGQYPSIDISYETKNPSTYERELIDALAAGVGPDIFTLPSEKFSLHKNKIAPLRGSSAEALVELYPDAAKILVDDSRGILGIPWYLDSLALFYNSDHLNAANIPIPPATWEGVAEAVKKLTRVSPIGTIQRAGIALGLVDNVEHGTDIISALLIQAGHKIYDPKTGEITLGQDAGTSAASPVRFYADFADPKSAYYTWNSLMPNSKDAFAAERVSLYIGYAADIPRILEANAHLNFGVSFLPQLVPGERRSHARFEFFAVSRTSKNQELAWSVLSLFMDQASANELRSRTNLPPAHRQLSTAEPPHKSLAPFYSQILAARSWEIPDYGAVRAIFSEMVLAVLRGDAPQSAVGAADQKLELLIR